MALLRPSARPDLPAELHGLDALEQALVARRSTLQRLVSAGGPKLFAVAIVLLIWQTIVWIEWRPPWVLPGPAPVFARLWHDLRDASILKAVGVTMRRIAVGYGLALAVGAAVGIAVSRFRLLRAAIGSMITGLQTMPSIAWFPLAIVLFQGTENSILFVVVLGAAPAIANGLLSGIDHIPPLWLRAGRTWGAKGVAIYRHVVIPAALPGFVAGLKQGWAFAWRSLLAGELLVAVANRDALGVRLQDARETSDAEGLLAVMIVILVIGVVVDALLFATVERTIRRRRGLDVA